MTLALRMARHGACEDQSVVVLLQLFLYIGNVQCWYTYNKDKIESMERKFMSGVQKVYKAS